MTQNMEKTKKMDEVTTKECKHHGKVECHPEDEVCWICKMYFGYFTKLKEIKIPKVTMAHCDSLSSVSDNSLNKRDFFKVEALQKYRDNPHDGTTKDKT